MRNLIDLGDVFEVTAPGNIANGQLVRVGNVYGVATHPAAVGRPLALQRRGIFTLPKSNGVSLVQGAVALWGGASVSSAGDPIGYVASAAGSSATTVAVLLSPDAQLLGQQSPSLTAVSGSDALIWWPLAENLASASANPVISDSAGLISGTYQGGTRRWGPWPGLAFDSGAYLPMSGGAMAGMTAAARRCANFASLQRGVDMVTVWAVFSHPAPITGGLDRSILSWGATQGAKGGWTLGMGGSRERFYSILAPQGVTTVANCRTEYAGDKISGMAISPAPPTLNTLTAVAFEVMADTAGYLVSNVYSLPLNADFGIELKPAGFNSLSMVPAGSGGTAASTDDVDAPFTIGARPTTNATTVTDHATALSFLQVGIARCAFSPSLGMRIVRDLRTAPRAMPASLLNHLGA